MSRHFSQILAFSPTRFFFDGVSTDRARAVAQLSPPGPSFDNCYSFHADGTFDDPVFPVLGTWTQHSVGAATTYTATAGIPGVITLVQEGKVTPARGRGILQLEAHTTVVVAEAGELPFEVLFLSRGQEVDGCP